MWRTAWRNKPVDSPQVMVRHPTCFASPSVRGRTGSWCRARFSPATATVSSPWAVLAFEISISFSMTAQVDRLRPPVRLRETLSLVWCDRFAFRQGCPPKGRTFVCARSAAGAPSVFGCSRAPSAAKCSEPDVSAAAARAHARVLGGDGPNVKHVGARRGRRCAIEPAVEHGGVGAVLLARARCFVERDAPALEHPEQRPRQGGARLAEAFDPTPQYSCRQDHQESSGGNSHRPQHACITLNARSEAPCAPKGLSRCCPRAGSRPRCRGAHRRTSPSHRHGCRGRRRSTR